MSTGLPIANTPTNTSSDITTSTTALCMSRRRMKTVIGAFQGDAESPPHPDPLPQGEREKSASAPLPLREREGPVAQRRGGEGEPRSSIQRAPTLLLHQVNIEGLGVLVRVAFEREVAAHAPE